jgi:uncharacterized protein YigA (DUF484 family)
MAAEYNRIKLDIATTRAELIRVQADFAGCRDKSDQQALDLARNEGLQRRVEMIQRIVEDASSLEEVQEGILGDEHSLSGRNGNVDIVEQELARERSRNKELEAMVK